MEIIYPTYKVTSRLQDKVYVTVTDCPQLLQYFNEIYLKLNHCCMYYKMGTYMSF